MPARILVLDPLTLIGREFLAGLDQVDPVRDIEFMHTEASEEHQIAELGTGPALAAPLADADALSDRDLVVVASDQISSRHDHLLEHLEHFPDAAVLDLSRLAILDDVVEPTAGLVLPSSRRLRVAHPAVTAAAIVLEALDGMAGFAGSLVAFEPASVYGREAVDLLVQQAARRLQGGSVEHLIHGRLLAFNVVAVDPSPLQAEASKVLADVPLAVSRFVTGSFHGHLAVLALGCDAPVDRHEMEDALGRWERLELAGAELGLDSVPDADVVRIATPSLSADGRQVNLTMMMDGLRTGGALTAFDILRKMV
jgi:aspartate-semialdehyde dehydrogenase